MVLVSALGSQRQAGLCELEVSLIYKESSRRAKTSQDNNLSGSSSGLNLLQAAGLVSVFQELGLSESISHAIYCLHTLGEERPNVWFQGLPETSKLFISYALMCLPSG